MSTKLIKFHLKKVEETYQIYTLNLSDLSKADIITIAEFPNSDSVLAHSICALLNVAYNDGHLRGLEFAKESLISAMGIEE